MAKQTKIRVRVTSTSIVNTGMVPPVAPVPGGPVPEAPKPMFQIDFQSLEEGRPGQPGLSITVASLGGIEPGDEGDLTFTPSAG